MFIFFELSTLCASRSKKKLYVEIIILIKIIRKSSKLAAFEKILYLI